MPALPKLLSGYDSVAMGALGSDYITNTSARAGDWAIIEVITDAVFTTLTGATVSTNGGTLGAAGNMNGLALTAGKRLYGRFTAITLASGSVMAYSAVPKS